MLKTITSKSGRKITLRPPKKSDTILLLEYINELITEDVLILINQKQTLKKQQIYVNQALENIKSKNLVQLLAFDQDKLVGNCQVDRLKYRSSHVGNFGITIRAGYRGDGIGQELAKQILKLAKTKLKLTIVRLDVFSQNDPAFSLYQKLGFKIYGTLPQGIKYHDIYVDRINMYKKL